MDAGRYNRYVFLSLFVLFIGLSIAVVLPFARLLLAAAVMAYLFFPLHVRLVKLIRIQWLSSLLIVLLILLLVSVPVVLLLNSLFSQARRGVSFIIDELGEESILDISCSGRDSGHCRLLAPFENLKHRVDLKDIIVTGLSFLSRKASALLAGIVDFFFALFIVFFLLIDGPKLVRFIQKMLPMKADHENRIMATLKDTAHAVVFGAIVTAIVQGLLAGIGYWIIGNMKMSVLLGLATAFCALIPYMGTALVWLPVSAFLFISGIVSATPELMFRGVGLFLYGALVVSTIDNILRPKLIGSRANLHPVVVLLGVIGGLKLLGIVGIVIGPLILAVTLRFMHIFRDSRGEPGVE